ncbi:hypothetical protein NDU88_005597 [Pleurodeles waltl]|uniref:Uncharacterized protein n=1 Tax=Pleurodeles waltl TaxID=8319 RepID=A0AAV7NQQ8_PLEWA|nr:hypothetical protein NDU88_005597 [Pleurodeles waltl]
MAACCLKRNGDKIEVMVVRNDIIFRSPLYWSDSLGSHSLLEATINNLGGRGQADVNGVSELRKLRISLGLSDATRGFGGWRRLVGGGAGQLWGPGLWRDWALALLIGAEQIQAWPMWIHGPPSSSERQAQDCCGTRA